jgi:hypothetical protein
MALVVILDMPGMTQAQYEKSAEKVAGRPGPVTSTSDWPVAGLISHTAAPTEHGWLVVDVWDTEAAFEEFGRTLLPILLELGVPEVHPRTYPVFTMVTG